MNPRAVAILGTAVFAFLILSVPSLAVLAADEAPEISESDASVVTDLDALGICIQSGWFPVGAMPTLNDAGCTIHVRDVAIFYLDIFNGLYDEAQLHTTFLVPAPPSPGTSPFGIQFLNHLAIAYAFDEEGIEVAPIGDVSEFPPAPSSREGRILARIAYGVPFHLTVKTNKRRHRIEVRQAGEFILSAAVEKASPHPDPLTFLNFFVDTSGTYNSLEWTFASAEFKGETSEEGGIAPVDPGIATFSFQRVGDVIRVLRH